MKSVAGMLEARRIGCQSVPSVSKAFLLIAILFLSVMFSGSQRDAHAESMVACVAAGRCTAEQCAAYSAEKNLLCKTNALGGCDPRRHGRLAAAQCLARATSIMACLVARFTYQATCFPAGSPGEVGHLKTIANENTSLAKCLTCAGLSDGVKGACMRMCSGLSSLGRILGPIGVAYTVGEIGAACIEIGGQLYCENLERTAACSRLEEVRQMKVTACAEAARLREEFARDYCSVDINFSADACGPTAFAGIHLGSGCDGMNVSCDRGFDAATRYEAMLEAMQLCAGRLRLYGNYLRVCEGSGNSCGRPTLSGECMGSETSCGSCCRDRATRICTRQDVVEGRYRCTYVHGACYRTESRRCTDACTTLQEGGRPRAPQSTSLSASNGLTSIPTGNREPEAPGESPALLSSMLADPLETLFASLGASSGELSETASPVSPLEEEPPVSEEPVCVPIEEGKEGEGLETSGSAPEPEQYSGRTEAALSTLRALIESQSKCDVGEIFESPPENGAEEELPGGGSEILQETVPETAGPAPGSSTTGREAAVEGEPTAPSEPLQVTEPKAEEAAPESISTRAEPVEDPSAATGSDPFEQVEQGPSGVWP